MAQYQPSYVDVSGFSKAISDAAYKAQQLALKQEDYMNRSIDNQFKMYSGKLRKNDAAKFDSYFAEYEQAQKQYQRLNRIGGRPDEIRKASELAAEKKSSMMNFVERSTAYGAYQMGLAKMYKDPSKLVNRDKFTNVYSTLDSLNADELDQEFGGLDKMPKSFEVSEKDYDMGKVFTNIKKITTIGSPSNYKEEFDYVVDGKQVTKNYTTPSGVTLNIPQKVIRYGASPSELYQSIWVSTTQNQQDKGSPDVYLKKYQDEVSSGNPVLVKDAQDRIQRTMKSFNIQDPSQVTGAHLMAQTISDQNMKEVVVEDWTKYQNIEDEVDRATNRKLKGLALQKAVKELQEQKQASSLEALKKVGSLYGSFLNSGFAFNPGAMQQLKNAIQQKFPGIEISVDALNKAAIEMKKAGYDVSREYFNEGEYPETGGRRQ